MNKLSLKSIKESFDNLPSGVCYFNKKGMLVLCNKIMHYLVYELTNHDLQIIDDLTTSLNNIPINSKVIKEGDYYIFSNKRVYTFYSNIIKDNDEYIEYLAIDITELYERKKILNLITLEQTSLSKKLKKISENVVNITREEEILTIKMRIHNQVGEVLQKVRKDYINNMYDNDKTIEDLKQIVNVLKGQIGVNDETNVIEELNRLSQGLGVNLIINGDIPNIKRVENIILKAIRECITNTIKHAKGNELYVDIKKDNEKYLINISNNGIIPIEPICEKGGLLSLRKSIEKIGGEMIIKSSPKYILTIII